MPPKDSSDVQDLQKDRVFPTQNEYRPRTRSTHTLMRMMIFIDALLLACCIVFSQNTRKESSLCRTRLLRTRPTKEVLLFVITTL